MGDLSTNFSRGEFACKGKNCCGGSAPVNTNLVLALQVLRERIGQPLTITSGFRCIKHNAAVGGAKNSQHLYGTAADITAPKGLNSVELYHLADEIGLFDGLGLYDWGIHVDVRGSNASWDYRTGK